MSRAAKVLLLMDLSIILTVVVAFYVHIYVIT